MNSDANQSSKLANHVIIPLVIIMVSIALASYLIFAREPAAEREIEHQPLLVKAIKAQAESVEVTLPSQGEVKPRTATVLTAEVPGTITHVADSFNSGGFFKKGEILLEIDKRNYQARVKRAEATAAQARSQLAQEKGRAEVAADDFRKHNKAESLSKDARELALRKPQLAEAQAMLDSALAELQQARNDLERTTIRAPYDGLVREKHVDIGQYVNTGSPLANTFAVDYAEVRLPVSETHLPYLDLPAAGKSQQQPAAITLTQTINGKQYQYPAELVRTEGVLDPKSRVLFVIARVTDPYGIKKVNNEQLPLRIGSFVEANISGKTIDDIIVIPRNTLRPGNKVWAIENNTLQEYKVSVLPVPGENALVNQGLPENSTICLTAVGPVMPGTKVEIVE